MLQLYALRTAIAIIACFSALSSVIGLGSIFQAIFYPMIVIGIGLELAKYSAVSYVYTNYTVLDWKLRIGAWLFIPALVLFTSLGIYGFLGSAFTESNLARQKNQVVVDSLTVQKAKLEEHLSSINKQVAELPTNFVRGRIKLMESFNADKKHDQVELDAINLRLEKYQTDSLEVQSHMGVIVFVATAINVPIEKAIAMLILCLTLCLDPFAIYLTMLSNKRSIKYNEPKVEEPKVEEPKVEDSPKLVEANIMPVEPDLEDEVMTIEPDFDDINMQLAESAAAAAGKVEVDTKDFDLDESEVPLTAEEFYKFISMYRPVEPVEPVEPVLVLPEEPVPVLPEEPVPTIPLAEYQVTPVIRTGLRSALLRSVNVIVSRDTALDQLAEKYVAVPAVVEVIPEAAPDAVPTAYLKAAESDSELNGFESLSEDDFAPSEITVEAVIIKPVEPTVRPEAMPHPHGKSRFVPLPMQQAIPKSMPQADNNLPTLGNPTHADFGSMFPAQPGKGDVYLRTDFLPNRLFKFNGNKWILIDKAQIDVYAYEEKYIEHLINQISTNRLDVEYLTDTEREQITKYLKTHV